MGEAPGAGDRDRERWPLSPPWHRLLPFPCMEMWGKAVFAPQLRNAAPAWVWRGFSHWEAQGLAVITNPLAMERGALNLFCGVCRDSLLLLPGGWGQEGGAQGGLGGSHSWQCNEKVAPRPRSIPWGLQGCCQGDGDREGWHGVVWGSHSWQCHEEVAPRPESWGLQGFPAPAAGVAGVGVLPAQGDRHIQKPPLEAGSAWIATLCCWAVLPALLQVRNVPQHPPPAFPGAQDAAAARKINNQRLVKLFCQIYTFSRRSEGEAGAAAAPLDGRIHHGL